MIRPTSWLQHYWCLYVCWLIQLPALCFISFMTLISYSRRRSRPIADQLEISLFCITIVSYIYQVFFYFIHRLNATCMLYVQVYGSFFITFFAYCESWYFMHGNTLWGSLVPKPFTTKTYAFAFYASFYILLARSLLVWYQVRKLEQNSLSKEDEEEMENLLSGEHYV